uniref:Uncharacterized protein n=1 Tax=Anguilla anguilla TaxID=7936 RepID=A0A0E9T9K1_ANGAN
MIHNDTIKTPIYLRAMYMVDRSSPMQSLCSQDSS